MSIMSMVGIYPRFSKALDEARSFREDELLRRTQVRPISREITKTMDIKLLKLYGDRDDYARQFKVKIDEVELMGRVTNKLRPDSSIGSMSEYTLAITFDNKEVRKHKKYPDIRREILLQIIEIAVKEKGIGSSNFLMYVRI